MGYDATRLLNRASLPTHQLPKFRQDDRHERPTLHRCRRDAAGVRLSERDRRVASDHLGRHAAQPRRAFHGVGLSPEAGRHRRCRTRLSSRDGSPLRGLRRCVAPALARAGPFDAVIAHARRECGIGAALSRARERRQTADDEQRARRSGRAARTPLVELHSVFVPILGEATAASRARESPVGR